MDNITFTGKEFNEIYKNVIFYKFLRDDLKHFDYTYKNGLNIDPVPFYPFGKCQAGGMYFCEEMRSPIYIGCYGKYYSTVTIPDDAFVCVENYKFKANKIYLDEIKEIGSIENVKFWELVLSIYPQHLDLIHPSNPVYEKMCECAIKNNGFVLRKIGKNVTDPELYFKLCEISVKQSPEYIIYVSKNMMSDEQYKQICRIIVETHSTGLRFIDQTHELCKFAVQKFGCAINYVKVQTPELCKLAVLQNEHALVYIKDQQTYNEMHNLIYGLN
ncbi:MAG: hypothetical protein EBQ92_00715 [Proteobacteria bacterium]|nr:hypothetical protein [Pseudomonadota bacterium]